MEALAGVLRQERWLLEVLVFRLTEARYVLASGDSRFVSWAVAEVERAVERLREAELRRASVVMQVAADLGVPEQQLTLHALAEHSPEPYRFVFADHRNAFRALVAEVQELTAANRKLAQRGLRGLTEVLDLLGEGPSDPVTYGPDGRSDRRSTPAFVDRAL